MALAMAAVGNDELTVVLFCPLFVSQQSISSNDDRGLTRQRVIYSNVLILQLWIFS